MTDRTLNENEQRRLMADMMQWARELREANLPAGERERILVARVTDTVNVARARKGRPPLEMVTPDAEPVEEGGR